MTITGTTTGLQFADEALRCFPVTVHPASGDPGVACNARVPSLDGRTLVGVSNTGDGEVDVATAFTYHQRDDLIWAEYAGGAIVMGRLVGTRFGDALDFRYVHVAHDGTTSAGHCTSRLEQLSDGRLRSYEAWRWESRSGSGRSIIEEASINPSAASQEGE